MINAKFQWNTNGKSFAPFHNKLNDSRTYTEEHLLESKEYSTLELVRFTRTASWWTNRYDVVSGPQYTSIIVKLCMIDAEF